MMSAVALSGKMVILLVFLTQVSAVMTKFHEMEMEKLFMTFDLLQEKILLWIEFRESCVTHAPRWATDSLCISLHFSDETSRRFFTWDFQASQQLLSFFAEPTPILKAQQPFRHFQENKMEKN